MCFCTSHNDRFTEDYLGTLRRRKYSVRTLQTYGNAIAHFIEFIGDINLQDVTPDQIEAYRLHLIERGLTPASMELFMRAIRQLFTWMEQTGHTFLNPCRELIIPNPGRKLLPVPTEEDIRKLLAQPNTSTPKGIRDRALIEVAYSTGARREELLRMTIFDPDTKTQTIRIRGKGNKERIVPLGRHAVHWLNQYLEHARPKLLADQIDQEALWIGNAGAPQSGQSINLQVKTHAKAAGTSIPISLHALRRACATHMLQNGAHPIQIQILLGHATMRHLSQYLRLSIHDLKAMHEKTKPGK